MRPNVLQDFARRTRRSSAPSIGRCYRGAELAVYVQTLQGRAHTPCISDCKKLNVVIKYMKRRKCGLNSVELQHPLKLVAFIDVAFKTQFREPIGLAFRGLAAILC